MVHLRVSDDGEGFSQGSTPKGAGLTNIADRIGAVGGTVAVSSELGEGTTVEIRIRAGASNRARSGVVRA